MADTCGDPLDCDDIRLGSAAILAASYVRLADGPNGELRTARRVTSCTGGGGGGGIVNTVGWTNQYGMSANTSGTTAVLIQPVGTEGLVKTIAQIGHGLTLGQAVRMNGGAYVAAQGTAAGSACVGFILEVVSANQFRVLLSGHSASAPAAMFSGLTAGTAYYLSPSSAGALTATPNAFGIVLIATSTTAGYVVSNAQASGIGEYVAKLAQSGTDAPVATVLKNTLGGTVVWSYGAPGTYSATLVGAFPTEARTYLEIDQQKTLSLFLNESVLVQANRTSADAVQILVGDLSDGWIDTNWFFRITVYPA